MWNLKKNTKTNPNQNKKIELMDIKNRLVAA